jgi:hypothetical protein
VGENPDLHNQSIAALHCSALGGHSGIPMTYSKLKQAFAWRGMKSDVHRFVKSYQTCIQAKPDRSPYPGKLQPLSVPSEAWETISMDFIAGLPRTAQASCILVVVDKFTGMLISFPCLTLIQQYQLLQHSCMGFTSCTGCQQR